MADAKKPLTNIAMIVVTAVSAVVGSMTVRHLFTADSGMPFDRNLMQIASELNKTLPMMVDSETRLDNVVAGPGKVFQYRYTIVNHTKDDLDAAALVNALRPTNENNYRTNPDMKTMREEKVTMRYSYSDKNGVFVTDFSVGP